MWHRDKIDGLRHDWKKNNNSKLSTTRQQMEVSCQFHASASTSRELILMYLHLGLPSNIFFTNNLFVPLIRAVRPAHSSFHGFVTLTLPTELYKSRSFPPYNIPNSSFPPLLLDLNIYIRCFTHATVVHVLPSHVSQSHTENRVAFLFCSNDTRMLTEQ
jgi:hypothetical protein